MPALEDFPRVPLVPEPTPLHPLPRLSAEVGLQVWCKRDDLTRLALGGNKLRKLEFLLREALDQGADTVITIGAAQSNHARLTAAAAAVLGLRTILVLDGPIVGRGQGNLLLDDLLGAEVRLYAWERREEGAALLEQVAEEVRQAGRRPYVIPLGGSNALGTLGYALAARELARQAEIKGLSPRAVVCATSSCGTQAGLVLGRALYRLPWEVVGISVGEPATDLARTVARLASEAAERLGIPPIPEDEVIVLDGYAGPGYGRMDPATAETIRRVASLEGILLDPVYTGKAMAGLLDLARRGRWEKGETVVFLHTGGIPALFAYWEALGVAGKQEPM
ncbi:MAG: 1-aminocyclopropane-1-carboxylate deaminase/D-cysteine desulfhydrase [Chloroflexia bacterium]